MQDNSKCTIDLTIQQLTTIVTGYSRQLLANYCDPIRQQTNYVKLYDDITIRAGENQIQKDVSDFVTVTSQTFEEKMVHMIEKLSKKVDNLKQVTPPMGPRNTGTSETGSGLLMDKFNENMKRAVS
jgi:hypothetical protein